MLNIQGILHPTDLSTHSMGAFRVACALARDYGARLIVLHVAPVPTVGAAGIVPSPPVAGSEASADDTQKELAAALRDFQAKDAKVPIEHRVEHGDPADVIRKVAAEARCDLIVMGTHGRTGLRRMLMGSVAEQVLRRGTCPVLIVKAPLPEPAASSKAEAARVVHAT
jgi:nucleotide-binding universal stress UspA family protein